MTLIDVSMSASHVVGSRFAHWSSHTNKGGSLAVQPDLKRTDCMWNCLLGHAL